jgi:hypothetical protein
LGKQRFCLRKFSGKFAEALKDLDKSVGFINFKMVTNTCPFSAIAMPLLKS